MPTVTLAQMRTQVYDRVENNTLLYQTGEVDDAINEQLRILNCYAGWFQQTVGFAQLSIPKRFFYDIPAPIIIPLNVKWNRQGLDKSSLTDAIMTTRDVLTRTSAVDGPPRYWVPLGLRKMMLVPADAVGGRYMEVTGIADPPKLVNATDSFSLSNEYAEAIEDGAFISLVLKEGGKILADALRSVYPKYKAKLMELRKWQTLKNKDLSRQLVNAR